MTDLTQTGIDALEFIKTLTPEDWQKIDCVIWDPPYSDVGGFYDRDYVDTTHRRRGKNTADKLREHKDKVVMDREKRIEIYDTIIIRSRAHTGKNPVFVHFFGNLKGKQETDFPTDTEHIWFKSNVHHSGNYSMNNHEYFYFAFHGNRRPGKSNNGNHMKLIWAVDTDAGYNHKTKTFMFTQRMAQKPKQLFLDIYQKLECAGVLDPFAGFGNSIRAARALGLHIYACDIDDTLDWEDTELSLDDYWGVVL